MYDLHRLQRETEKICEMAYKARERFKNDAVNWANFHCVDAQYILHEDDTESYRVIIEEASPENSEVRKFIQMELELLEYQNIEVDFEW